MNLFPELSRLESLVPQWESIGGKVSVLSKVTHQDHSYPIYGFYFGDKASTLPAFGLVGGVHGLERIGTQVATAYLESMVAHFNWDDDFRNRMKGIRFFSIPLLNPGGMHLGLRSNPNGVDLMRNAPVEALAKPAFLVGGHRIGPWMPWYRGSSPSTLEVESQTLIHHVQEALFGSPVIVVLDLHSGFGFKDRLWYPYAKTVEDFPQKQQALALGELLNRSNPHHVYSVEAQSLNYTTHGDLWDYLFDLHQQKYGSKHVFLPWTLEMGSWLWVKKNPIQLLSSIGVYNPIKVHRQKRALRRHLPLIDFMLRATRNHEVWSGVSPA